MLKTHYFLTLSGLKRKLSPSKKILRQKKHLNTANAVAVNDSIAVSKQSKTAFISAEGVVTSDSVEVGAKKHRKTPENEEHIARNDSNTVLKQSKATFITAEDVVASDSIVVGAKKHRKTHENEKNITRNDSNTVLKQSKATFITAEDNVASNPIAVGEKERRKMSGNEENTAKNVSIEVSKQSKTTFLATKNIVPSCSSAVKAKKHRKTTGKEGNIAKNNPIAVLATKQPRKLPIAAGNIATNVSESAATKKQKTMSNMAESLSLLTTNSSAQSTQNQPNVLDTVATSSPIPADRNKQVKTLDIHENAAANHLKSLAVNSKDATVISPRNTISVSEKENYKLPNNNCVTLPNNRMSTPKNVNVNSGSNAVPKKKLRTIIPQSNSVVVQDPGLECPSNKQSADLVRNSLVVDSQELQVNSDVAANDSCSVPQWQIVLNPQFVTQKRAATHDMPSEGDDDLQIASSCDIASNLQVIQNPAASVAINLGPINEVVNLI